jgi:quercetin dioxygenase-like cupin family protein
VIAGITLTRQGVPSGDVVRERFRDEGLSPHSWSNGPGDRYHWHTHAYHKVLYCVRGAITFHTRDGDYRLEPGDRLDVEPGTEHAATVGPDGVECMEAPR